MRNKLPIIFFMIFSLIGCSSKDIPQEPKEEPTDKPALNTKSTVSIPTTKAKTIILKRYNNHYPNKDAEKPEEKGRNTTESKHLPEKNNKNGNKFNTSGEAPKQDAANGPNMSQSTGDLPTRKKKFQEGIFGDSWNSMKRTFSDGIAKVKKIVKR